MNRSMTESLNTVFQAEFESLLTVSMIGSVVAILALALHCMLRRWLTPRMLSVLWLLVIVRFILFTAPESPTSFLNLIQETHRSIQVVQSESTPAELGDSPIQSFTVNNIPLPKTTRFSETELQNDIVQTPILGINISSAAKLVWFAGFFGMSLVLLIRLVRVFRVVANATEASSQLKETFHSLQQRLGFKRLIKLKLTDDLQTPAMAGCFRPTVLLPRWCKNELTERQMEMVLIHELIHIRRCDGLIQLATHIVKMLHWFNPLVRIAGRHIEACRELSCDRQVIKLLAGDTDPEMKRLYGRTILQVAERHSAKARISPAVFVGGFIGSNDDLVKQRIAMLVRSKSKWKMSAAVSAIGVASIITLIAVGFTSAQSSSPPTSQELNRRFPNSSVEKKPAFPMTVHSGTAPSQKQIDEISAIAKKPNPLGVINELRVQETSSDKSEWLAIKVKVLEISRSKLRALGVDFTLPDGSKPKSILSIGDLVQQQPDSLNRAETGMSFGIVDNLAFPAFIQALEKNGIAKLLDEPVLVATDSRPAEFISGSEIPKHVVDDNGKSIVEVQYVGTKLHLVPTFDKHGELTLMIRAEVSEIAEDLADDAGMPGFRSRRLNTDVKIKSGQMLALSGGFRENDNGEMESELLFLITPTLHNGPDAKISPADQSD